MNKQNFEKALYTLKNMRIGLFLNDNQFIEGVLLDVKQDHLIIEVDQNILYFALQHIHALSKDAKDFRISSTIVPHLDGNDLAELLSELRYSWVTINSLSNQAFFGVLSKISDDHIILINNQEQLYIQKSFISNIYKGIYEVIEQVADNESVTPMNEELKEQTNSTQVEKVQSTLQELKTAVEPIQTINDSESKEYVDTGLKEDHATKETKVERLSNELPEIYTKNGSIIDESNLLLDEAIQESTSYTNSPLIEQLDIYGEETAVEELNNESLETPIEKEPLKEPNFSQDEIIPDSTSYTNNPFIEPFNTSPTGKWDFMEGQYFSIESIRAFNKRNSEKHIEPQFSEIHDHAVLESSYSSPGDEQTPFSEPEYQYKKRRRNSRKRKTPSNHHHEITVQKNSYS